jgi:hypothetical protein
MTETEKPKKAGRPRTYHFATDGDLQFRVPKGLVPPLRKLCAAICTAGWTAVRIEEMAQRIEGGKKEQP